MGWNVYHLWKITSSISILQLVSLVLIQNLTLICSVNQKMFLRNNLQVLFLRNTLFLGNNTHILRSDCSRCMFMNERQPNSQEHEDYSEWQRRQTRLLWLMQPSTQRIEKDIRASPQLFTRMTDNVICFTAFTGDGHDKLAAMDLSMIAVVLTPSWLVWILTVMPVWLYFSSFLFWF